MSRSPLVALAACLLAPTPARAQQRFGLELGVGQSNGLTSYRRDVVYAQPTNQPNPDPDPELAGQPLYQPYLADERNGWGPGLSLRLLIGAFEIGLSAQLHDRSQLRLHHQGTSLISERRRRPDQTWDDSGIDYIELDEPREVLSRQRNRGDLLVASLLGGWRLEFDYDPFTLFFPVTFGLAMVNITEQAQPFVFGFKAGAGAGASYRLSESFALTGSGRLGLLGTIEYDPWDDAARRAALTGRSTPAALISTLVQGTVELGVTFWVR